MNVKLLLKVWLCTIPFLLAACNGDESFSSDNKSKIVCSVDEFQSTDGSRTNTDPDNGFLITWASGDVIGIFPREGYQEPFAIPSNQVNQKNATFDGGYWALKKGLAYNAYYPFDKKNFDSADMKTKIPVTYIGQYQNGTSCNIGAFDYTYSDWKTVSDGAINFDFHHLGAIAVFSLPFPATTTYTKLTLSVDEALIPLKGTYDLTAEDVSIEPDKSSMSTSIDLDLNNCSGVAGKIGTFYMMLPPMDLSNKEVVISLISSAGTTCTYLIDKTLNAKKGRLYRRTGIPKDSKIEGTVDGWVEDEEDTTPYITFKADAEQTFKMSKAVATLEYSVNDGEWKELGTTTVTFGGAHGNLRLRGQSVIGTAKSYSSYSRIYFFNNVPVACVGDIRTLIDYENYQNTDTSNARFCRLFEGCKDLWKTPNLPSTNLADWCYYMMFSGCRNIISAPELPAVTLSERCYRGMFNECTSLTTAPKLPALTLAGDCYNSMFSGCTKITEAPILPVITLTESCYLGMFKNCTSLKEAPILPATSLTEYCYSNMFLGCTSLTKAPELPVTTLAAYCYSGMFRGCTNLKEAPQLPATIMAEGCYSQMFQDCRSLTIAPILPATTLTEFCYNAMFTGCINLNSITILASYSQMDYDNNVTTMWVDGVASTGVFVKVSDAKFYQGIHGIPNGWIVKNYSE